MEGGHAPLPVLLVCEVSPVPGSVVWGQEQGDASLAAGCSPRQHPTPPAALAKAAKILFGLPAVQVFSEIRTHGI